MRRREFITLLSGAAAGTPLARAWAEESNLPAIGFLMGSSRESQTPFLLGFPRGLSETGYIEGRNVLLQYRSADLHLDRLPALADELIRRGVAIIVTTGGVQAAITAIHATKTIPILFVGGIDPVKLGWVESLDHPGRNVTGVSFLSNALEAKRLGLLHDTIPGMTVVGVLMNPQNPTSQQQIKDLNDAGHILGLTLHVAHAARQPDLEPAFNSLMQRGAQAIVAATDANFLSWRDELVALTRHARIPAIFHSREFAVAGGFLSYGANLTEAFRLAGIQAGRILKGDKPGNLPVQQSTRVEFVINLATAKLLGLEIPSGVLAIADEVIE